MPCFWSLWSFLEEAACSVGKYMNLAVGYFTCQDVFHFYESEFLFF